jgi:predicted RNA binding protein YcfA (HicA-like mRNA interferase family)
MARLLEEHGFILDRTKGSHHIYYHPETPRNRPMRRGADAQRRLSVSFF